MEIVCRTCNLHLRFKGCVRCPRCNDILVPFTEDMKKELACKEN